MSETTSSCSDSSTRSFKLGLLINPVAGLGGPAGLKGSDAPNTAELARARGVCPKVYARVREVLDTLSPFADQIQLLLPDGAMGLELSAPWQIQHIYASPEQTQAIDTQHAARALSQAGVDLLLFAGGDGTARDVFTAVGGHQAVLGIPSGVKMHSGVFAVSPRAAASVVSSMIKGRLVAATQGEVRDIDEVAFAKGQVKTRYFGEMLVPDDQLLVQKVKCSGLPDDDLQLEELTAYLSELIEEDSESLWVLGSGGTLKHLKNQLGMDNPTLLGVDLWAQDTCITNDVYESQLWQMIQEYDSVRVVLSVIGGQGVILGRGNQQISARIIEKIGLDNLIFVSTPEKLRALDSAPLQVDSGSASLDSQLQGFRKVICGYEDTVLYPIS